jgi:hypothetical protein
MYKNKPKPETKQATLARVKKEMDEPRMAESARKEDLNRTTRQKLESRRNHTAQETAATEDTA